MTARQAVRMSEADLLANVLDLCRFRGVRTAHFRPARTATGWRTAVQGDGKGFVDLLLVGRNRVAYRELKSAGGKLDPDQVLWRDALLAAGQDWALWTPDDWVYGVIDKELKALAKGAADAAL